MIHKYRMLLFDYHAYQIKLDCIAFDMRDRKGELPQKFL